MAPPDLAVHTGRSSRSHSISSDRPSLTGFGNLLSPPISITPDPAFIAASAASQIVTNDHDSLADTWFDQHGIEPSGETALVAPPALKLVNRFLDQLLFNFLSISKSTSLGSLRPAVSEVLKPKLAKDAINGADQELHEYLGGGEDEELLAFHNGLEPGSDWDLELVWKRTRLRCMVYSSLGDMEEEDEDYYTDQEQLDGPPGSNSNRFSNNPGVVSPAVAIFLTSILEYMGEQVLVVAGQAAYHRLRAKHEREEREGTSTRSEIADRVVVEESDMERVALDRTLGRLWRGWKKRIRSPTNSISMTRSFSRESLTSQAQGSRATSMTPEEAISEDVTSLAAVLAEYEHAATIPLPITDDDVREIEIPGLAKQSDDEEEEESRADEELLVKLRPKSMIIFDHPAPESPAEHSQTANFLSPKPKNRRNSLPPPSRAPYSSPSSSTEVPAGEDGGEVEGSLEKEPVPTEEANAEPETVNEEKATSDDHKGVVVGVMAGAAALSAAVVAGVVAAANGEAPHTALESSKEETDAEEEFTEEPQIMTSSRVSIGGGHMTPDEPKALSRRSSVRSSSVHSLRLIDVTAAKSPVRDRTGSMDAADYVSTGRPTVTSRPGSIHSPVLDTHTPLIASPVARGATSSPVVRNGSSVSARRPAGGSISELEEKEAIDTEPEPRTAVPADVARAVRDADVDPSPTLSQFTADSSSGGATPHASTFILSAPPAARNLRDGPTSHPSDHSDQQSSTLPAPTRALGVENGVPPLTPLREMMEGAADTSDEASSVAPSNYAQSMSEYGVNGHASSDSTSTKPSSRRVPDQEPSIQAQHNAINPLRSSPPRPSRDETRRIAPEPKSQRSIHTSGSGSSSNSHKIKPIRTSQESTTTLAEDKGRSFEQLIRSDQTIQYTLTPQNMRNIESPESPRYASHAGLPNSKDAQRPNTSRSHSSSVSKLTGLHSHPPIELPRSTKQHTPAPRPSNTGSRVRPNAPQPRDARVDRDSIGDFADFIRSTGPVDSYERIPPRTSPGHRGANGVARNGSASSPRSVAAGPTPRRTESSAGRSRLQARDATVTRGDSISDLIDFVRSGPQLGKENHRIPRTVAPFRTTMDSDQMSGAIGGRAVDASLPDPRYSQASTSAHNSINSQSALLSNTSKNKPLPIQNNREEEDMIPKRKTRRVRDPYAIDFSDDEEEEEYEAARKPKVTQEESLADFLKNVPPPPESTVTPIFVPAKNIRKKSSTSNLMSRFGRNGSGPQIPPKPDVTSQVARPQQPRQSYTPIAAKYSTTMNLNQPPPPTSNNYVSQLDTARNSSRTKVAQKSYQPRDAVSSGGRTNDLADFLMRSEPPSSTQTQTQPQTFTPIQKEEASAFQRMFGRKKVA